jgi:8-oxo-dGTP pyrophosphatase MutT (NUDIX family)
MSPAKPEIATLSTRLVYENRWMRVREDSIRRQDGSGGIYGVVEKPDFVTIAALEQGILHLVEQYRYPIGARFWELPQGSWETNPAVDPRELAQRELREETGLEASAMTYAGNLLQGYGYATQAYHVFLATGLRPGPVRLEHEEQGLISRPFALADVEGMIRDGTIRDATTVAALGLLRLKGLL